MYNDHKVKPIRIMFPKTTTFAINYDGQTKWIDYLIEDNNLLEKYNTIWDKVTVDIKKRIG